jgi:hypothetical protein
VIGRQWVAAIPTPGVCSKKKPPDFRQSGPDLSLNPSARAVPISSSAIYAGRYPAARDRSLPASCSNQYRAFLTGRVPVTGDDPDPAPSQSASSVKSVSSVLNRVDISRAPEARNARDESER